MNGDSTAEERGSSDFHLVELHGAWQLTIRRSDRLLAALEAAMSEAGPEQGAVFTLHVEPNLLPGQPFEVTVDVTGDGAPRAVDGPARPERRRS